MLFHPFLTVAASPSLALLMKSTSEEILHPTEEGRSAWSARLDGGDWKSHQEFGIAQIEDDFEALFSSGTGIPSLGYVFFPLRSFSIPSISDSRRSSFL